MPEGKLYSLNSKALHGLDSRCAKTNTGYTLNIVDVHKYILSVDNTITSHNLLYEV